MSGHQDPQIVKVINSSKDTVKSMEDLQKELQDNLISEWEENLGIPFPTVLNSKVFKLDVAMIYSSNVKVDEFVTGVMDLANSVFTGNMADIAQAATEVAKVAIVNIIGGGGVQVGFHGNAAQITHHDNSDKTYLAATYSSTQIADSQKWGVQENFYVAKYIFVVQELLPQHLENLTVKKKMLV